MKLLTVVAAAAGAGGGFLVAEKGGVGMYSAKLKDGEAWKPLAGAAVGGYIGYKSKSWLAAGVGVAVAFVALAYAGKVINDQRRSANAVGPK